MLPHYEHASRQAGEEGEDCEDHGDGFKLKRWKS
jgi:hypothetical protein